MMQLKYHQLTKGSDSPVLEPIPPDKIHGELQIGTVITNEKELYPFSIDVQSLLKHVTIFGASGSGKTNLGYIILQHLLDKKVPFLVFDWKRNYRDFLALTKQPIEVYTVGRSIAPFHLNPLIPPPGTTPETWLKKITEVIGRAYYVGEGVMHILHRGIDAVYQEFGVYQGTQERWPTLEDVRTWIEAYVKQASMKELKAQWIASTHRTLQSLCYGDMGKVINTQQSSPLHDLLNTPVILELDALPEADKTFIVDTLLLWIHHYRLQDRGRETLKHVILIEEAHHVLRKEELTARESILDVVLREIRELGEGIIMIDQSPAQFSQNAIGNSSTSFVFALKDKADVMSAANFLLLDTDEKLYLNQLPVGTCIVKLQDHYRKPFMLKLPHVRVLKGAITDEHFATVQGQDEFVGLPEQIKRDAHALLQAAAELKHTWKDSGSSGLSMQETLPTVERESMRVLSEEDKIASELDEMSIHFVRDLLQHPFAGISTRYERLGISTRHGNRIKESLEQSGLIEIMPVNRGDAQVKLAQLTPLGKQLARRLFPDWRITKALNGAEHRYWKDRVATALENAGLTVEQEKPTNGHRVDVHAQNGHKTAVEIETGKSNIAKNIQEDLKAGYKEILVVPTNKRAKRKIKQALHKMSAMGHQT
jgi:DNA-binding PadR family transcriptional regulator